jgi:hypothetical protein
MRDPFPSDAPGGTCYEHGPFSGQVCPKCFGTELARRAEPSRRHAAVALLLCLIIAALIVAAAAGGLLPGG